MYLHVADRDSLVSNLTCNSLPVVWSKEAFIHGWIFFSFAHFWNDPINFAFQNSHCNNHFPSPKLPNCLNISFETMTRLLSSTDASEMFTLNFENLGRQYKARGLEEKSKLEIIVQDLALTWGVFLYCLRETHKHGFPLQKVIHHTFTASVPVLWATFL